MKLLLSAVLFALFLFPAAAQDTAKTRIVALPITEYIVPSDSIQVVQVQLPAGLRITEKQLGLLKGVYRNGKQDTANVGAGKCNLIKGEYYYFSLFLYKKDRLPAKGDLLFTRINKTDAYYGRIADLSALAITLQNVYGENLYEPLPVLLKWTRANEAALKDSLIADIRYTGKAMQEQQPEANVKVTTGKFKDQMIFDILQQTKKEDLEAFMDYIIARPRLYAGNSWKISEVFATWVNSGAPTIIK